MAIRYPASYKLPQAPIGKKGWPWTAVSEAPPQAMTDGHHWPTVTIVTPSYNQAKYLEETIRSVLLQGYPNLEYIIIDGGSTDGSVEIIRKYEQHLAYWVSESDRGQSHAINKGLKRATGEIVAWLNSDDVYEAHAIQNAVAYLTSRRLDMVYGDSLIVDERGSRTNQISSPDFELEKLLLSSFVPQQSTFFRRDVLVAVGLLNEDFHYAMDYDLWLRIAARFKVSKAPNVWANYRICQGTKSFSQPANFWPEIAKALEGFYAQPDLTTRIVETKSKAIANANLRAAVEFYQRNRFEEGSKHLDAAFNANPALIKDADQAVTVLVKFSSILEPRVAAEFVDQVFDNLPPSAQRLASQRERVALRGMLLSLNRYASSGEARSWIVNNAFDLFRDWRWVLKRPVFGIVLFLLIGRSVQTISDARRRIYPTAARLAE